MPTNQLEFGIIAVNLRSSMVTYRASGYCAAEWFPNGHTTYCRDGYLHMTRNQAYSLLMIEPWRGHKIWRDGLRGA